MATIRLAALVGSLRQNSYNASLLRNIMALLPEDFDVDIVPIGNLPHYNEDIDGENAPAVVHELRNRLRAADALIIVTPEYNYSIPGVLKNALDWAARPPRDSAVSNKPVALFGASAGLYGTVRAQLALRQVLAFTNSAVINRPEIMIPQATQKFDAEGNITDETTRSLLVQSVNSMVTTLRQSAQVQAAAA